jgi:hypothetical protein
VRRKASSEVGSNWGVRLSGQGDFRCRDGTGLGYFAFFFFLFLGCCSGVEFSQTTSNHAESPGVDSMVWGIGSGNAKTDQVGMMD